MLVSLCMVRTDKTSFQPAEQTKRVLDLAHCPTPPPNKKQNQSINASSCLFFACSASTPWRSWLSARRRSGWRTSRVSLRMWACFVWCGLPSVVCFISTEKWYSRVTLTAYRNGAGRVQDKGITADLRRRRVWEFQQTEHVDGWSTVLDCVHATSPLLSSGCAQMTRRDPCKYEYSYS